jgi:hypothetical protein
MSAGISLRQAPPKLCKETEQAGGKKQRIRKKIIQRHYTDRQRWIVKHCGAALSCRISVFTEKGKVKIRLIKPMQMLSELSQDEALVQVATEVEVKSIQIVDDTT